VWHAQLARVHGRDARATLITAGFWEMNCFELDCMPDVPNLVGK